MNRSLKRKMSITLSSMFLLLVSFFSFQSVEAVPQLIKDASDQWNAVAAYIEILDDITIVEGGTFNPKYNGVQRAFIADYLEIRNAFNINFGPDSGKYVTDYLENIQINSASIILNLSAGDLIAADVNRENMRVASILFFNQVQPILIDAGLNILANKIDDALTTFTESIITMADSLYVANALNDADIFKLAYDQVGEVLSNATQVGRLFGRTFIRLNSPA